MHAVRLDDEAHMEFLEDTGGDLRGALKDEVV